MGRTLRIRLIASFALVVLAFGAALVFVSVSVSRIQEAMSEVAMREEAVRYGLTLASCGRDQYIHTAHLLITHEEGHIQEVREVVKRMGDCQMHVRDAVSTPKEKADIDDLDVAAEEFRRVFFEGIVPAVHEHRIDDALDLHERSEALLSRIIAANDRLSASFRREIDDANERARAVARRALWVTVGVLLAGIGLAVGVGVFLGRSILGPIGDLLKGTEAVARGDLSPRIPRAPIAELERLRESFEVMTRELSLRERALVEAEKRASLGLLAAGVAHQINNPIGVILGYARLLEEGKITDPAAALRIVHDEAGEAKMIVETLLSLSRPGRIATEDVPLADLLADTAEHAMRYRRGAPAEVRVAPVPVGLAVRTDAKKLQQVLVNLLVNAIEAMPRGGAAELRALRREGSVAIEVSDEGPGLSDEQMARLFDPYFTTKQGGTGLGLAITSEIVRALGGTVEVRRREPRGSVFTVVLPDREAA